MGTETKMETDEQEKKDLACLRPHSGTLDSPDATDKQDKKNLACSVRYCSAGKLHTYGTDDPGVKPGSRVVVDMEPGQYLARVVACRESEEGRKPARKVLRLASDEDLAREQRNRERAEAAFRFCRSRIAEHRLPMRLVKVEYMFDASKAIFYFTSEGRVDFRELVKDLTREFNTRIEMRQVGVRDAAKQIGGHGPCGQELCCSKWLVDFSPVSVRMAKDQSLSLNPSKLSGVCGRLKCCLAYEHGTYLRYKSCLPKLGSRHESETGVGRVVKQDILGLRYTVAFEDGVQVEIQVPEPENLPPLPAAPPSRGKSGSQPRGQKPKEKGRDMDRNRDRDRTAVGQGPAPGPHSEPNAGEEALLVGDPDSAPGGDPEGGEEDEG